MFDLMGKMGELKKNMEAAKERLNAIQVVGYAGDGEIQVTMNGNRKLISIDIADHLLFPEKKLEVQELIEVAMNRALDDAEKVFEAEMKSAGKGMIPGF